MLQTVLNMMGFDNQSKNKHKSKHKHSPILSHRNDRSNIDSSDIHDEMNNNKTHQQILEEYKMIVKQTKPCPSELVNIHDSKIASKNRYTDIIPKHNTRVILNHSENDYINANWVATPYSKSILTQAPLEETIADFWKMILEQNVNIIVMCTNLEENGKIKSTHYWDQGIYQTTSSNNSSSQIIITEKNPPLHVHNHISNITISTLEIIWKNKKSTIASRIVTHVHFQDWNDYGTPISNESIDDLLKIINTIEVQYNNNPINNPRKSVV